MFMLSLKSICSPPFIFPFGTLQPDTAPAYFRSDVDVFRPLCGLRKLPLVATACAATMCHKKITSLCLLYHKKVILSILFLFVFVMKMFFCVVNVYVISFHCFCSFSVKNIAFFSILYSEYKPGICSA